MRFFSAIVAVGAVFATSASATSLYQNTVLSASLGLSLTSSNHYGAPTPPWKSGHKPGWYYGDNPDVLKSICPWLKDGLICKLLELLPFCLHCPKPPPPPGPTGPSGYTPVFTNYTGAVQAADYQTYGLVDTVQDCATMCNSVSGCTFFNTYHDVNGKDGSTQLTCSLFTLCHTEADADNVGGQTQPDGSVDYITDSAGYCKK